jgi:DNA-binding helix-hairpin-helix protein with protein kinase domain
MPRNHLVPTQRMARTCFLPMPMRSQTKRTQDEESNGVAGMTAPDLTEDELERRKDEQLAAREDKRQQLAENRKERQRARRRNEMAQAVARATVRDSKESLSESE